MFDRPEIGPIIATFAYNVFPFLVLPFVLHILTWDVSQNYELQSWLEIGFHVCNAVIMVICFGRYIVDSFFNVRYQLKSFFTTVGITVGMMLMVGYVVGRIVGFTENAWLAYGIFPLAEMELLMLSGDVLYFSPLIGLACMVLLAPIAISCMYYAPCFAPVCTSRPWLAYLLMALYLLLPRLINAFSFWVLAEEIPLYLVQLPVHLIACWSYQKTDTIWAPICSLAIVNLITGAGLILLYAL